MAAKKEINVTKDIIVFCADHFSVKTDNPRCIAIQHGVYEDIPTRYMTRKKFFYVKENVNGVQMKILALCDTIEFQNRATIEAISKHYGCIEVLCKAYIANLFKRKTKSNKLHISYFYTSIPERLRLINWLSSFELKIIKVLWGRKIKECDIILITSPHMAFLLPLLTRKKIIYLIIDPHILMKSRRTYFMEKQLLERADLILVTSKSLKEKYISKYFGLNLDNVYYWPNTVDLSIWDYEKLIPCRKNNGEVTIGFCGNMNEITVDMSLLDEITSHYNSIKFELAGKINFKNKDNLSKINKIFEKINVTYSGWISYLDIPRKVINWDICLMFDAKSEISEYVHHNKIYQYLALGKPIVIQRTHHDYDELASVVYICDKTEDFLVSITEAIKHINDAKYINNCIKLAKLNSSTERAKQFMNIIGNIKGDIGI